MTTKRELKEKIEALDRKVGAALGKITNVIEGQSANKTALLTLISTLKDLLTAVRKSAKDMPAKLQDSMDEYNLFNQPNEHEETEEKEKKVTVLKVPQEKPQEGDEWISGREASILLGWESRYISSNNLIKMGVAFRQKKKHGGISISRRSLEKYMKHNRK